jgi:hypothetical protein
MLLLFVPAKELNAFVGRVVDNSDLWWFSGHIRSRTAKQRHESQNDTEQAPAQTAVAIQRVRQSTGATNHTPPQSAMKAIATAARQYPATAKAIVRNDCFVVADT